MTTPPPPPLGDPNDPYGQPPSYQQPGYGQGYVPPPGYQQPPPGYGQGYVPPPGYGQPPAYGVAPYVAAGAQLAGWWRRVGGYLIDSIPVIVAQIALEVDAATGLLLFLAALAFTLWNMIRQGRTGQSLGKQVVGIRLVKEVDGQPVGGGLSVGRWFLHILDALPCYLGFLWPLWDSKKQTFADKLVSTLVIRA